MRYKFVRKSNESIHTWYSRIIKERMRGDPPHSLEEELDQFRPDTEESELFLTLISDFQLRDNYEAAEKLILIKIETDPRNPRPRLLLANHYLHESKEMKKALEAIDQALIEAESSKMFIREGYGIKARIALKIKNRGLYLECVERIIKIGTIDEKIDIGIERDFIDGVPDNVIPEKIRKEYDKMYQKYWD